MNNIALVIGATRKQKIPSLVTASCALRRLPEDRRHHVKVLHTWDKPELPRPKDEKNAPRTGFSFVRMAVADMDTAPCERALYVDSDQLMLSDWQELWDSPMGGAAALLPENQAAVVLYDLAMWRWKGWSWEALRGILDRGECRYDQMMNFDWPGAAAFVDRRMPLCWNSTDRLPAAGKGLLHYTDMRKQPWIAEGHKLETVWVHECIMAMQEKAFTLDEVKQEILLKNLRPDFLKLIGKEGLL